MTAVPPGSEKPRRAASPSRAQLSRTKGIPTASYGTDFNSNSKTVDDRSYLELRYEHRLSEHSDLSARLSGDLARSQSAIFL